MAELKIYKFCYRQEPDRTLCYLAAENAAEAFSQFKEKFNGTYDERIINPFNFPCEEVNERLPGFRITVKPLEQKVSSEFA